MEVPDFYAFAIGNGVVVHNSATRAAAVSLRFAKSQDVAQSGRKLPPARVPWKIFG